MNSRGERPATAQDVADLAGTSRTAVSFVLNGKADGNVAADVQDRVRAAAQQLNYSPHPGARSLRTQRTHLIGIVTDTIASSPFAGRLIAGASRCALENGYLAAVFDSHQRPEVEARAAQEFRTRRVDGLIYASMNLREVSDVARAGLPTVLANCFMPGDELESVIPDEITAGAEAADVLLSFGHRRIATITGVTNAAGEPDVAGEWRTTAFKERLATADVSPSVSLVPGDWSIDAGYHAAVRLLDVVADARPTAVFCINDRIAAGTMLAAARLGLAVPGDLSILGFDDQEDLAANLVPSLTTFALPHTEMGVAAMLRLITLVTAAAPSKTTSGASDSQTGTVEHLPRRRLLPSRLVARDSVGPPAI